MWGRAREQFALPAAKGLTKIWVDGDPENIATIRAALPLDGRLRLVEQMVTRENVTAIHAAAGSPNFSAATGPAFSGYK